MIIRFNVEKCVVRTEPPRVDNIVWWNFYPESSPEERTFRLSDALRFIKVRAVVRRQLNVIQVRVNLWLSLLLLFLSLLSFNWGGRWPWLVRLSCLNSPKLSNGLGKVVELPIIDVDSIIYTMILIALKSVLTFFVVHERRKDISVITLLNNVDVEVSLFLLASSFILAQVFDWNRRVDFDLLF